MLRVGCRRECGAACHCHVRPRVPARQGDAAAVCAAEARREWPARRRHAARDRGCGREAAREGRPRRYRDAPARLPSGHHRRARRRGWRPCDCGGDRGARAAGGAVESGRRQTHRNRAGGHTQPGGRAHLQHRWPERAERGDELRATSRTARLARRGDQSGAALPGRAQCREDLCRRERTLRARRLSLRERPGDVRAGLQVRPRLSEHLHSVARDFPAPR